MYGSLIFMIKKILGLVCMVTLTSLSASLKTAQLHQPVFDEFGTRYTLVQANPGSDNWLFVPGGPGFDATSLLPLVNQLELPGKTWLIDLPGNGDNTQDYEKGIFDTWSNCILYAVQQFEKPIYVGHSYGGQLALSLPHLEPLLKGLILIGSSPRCPDIDELTRMRKERGIEDLPNECVREFLAHQTNENFKRALFYQAVCHFPPASNFHATLWWRGKLPHYQAQWVPQTLPTLIIGGAQDCINPAALFDRDSRFRRPNCSIITLAQAGHFPWLEQMPRIRSLFDTYIQDFTTTTKKQVVVDCLITDLHNKTVLIQQRSGTRKLFPYCWDFIGGHLEPNESIDDCISRELHEEANMQLVNIIKQIHEFRWATSTYEVMDKVYMITAEGEFRLETDKAIAAKWITRNEATLLLKPGETTNEMYQAALHAFDYLDSI